MYQSIIQKFLAEQGYICLNPKAALIDMDGTLYDSMPLHARAWHQMMLEIGVEVPVDEFFRYEGRTGASTINILFNRAFHRDATQEEIQQLYHRKTELFSQMPPVSPMPGAAEMLDFLKAIDLRRVLVTGSGQSSLIDRLETDFPGAFTPELRVTSRDVTHGKPHPEPFLMAMKKAEVTPNECIVIENAPLGVEAGHAAGAFTIGVNTGPLDIRELEAAGADIVFPSMEEFARALPILIYGFVTTMRNLN